MPFDRQTRPQHSTAEAETHEAESPARGGNIQFSSSGPIPPVQMKSELPKGDKGFENMWAHHPHNDQEDETQNTSSDQVREDHGLPAEFENTCAIRLSIMLNGIGQTITPAKTKAAGLSRPPHYSKKTKQYYILGAAEVWQYLRNTFRKPDVVFPPQGRYKNSEEFQKGYEEHIKPAVAGKHGIVAFDKIFTYSGTGHMDLFDGEKLSDSSGWYESQRIELWYI